MPSFSERYGYAPERLLQVESMDARLRNRLANCLDEYTPVFEDYFGGEVIEYDFAKAFLDQMGARWTGSTSAARKIIETTVAKADWHLVYTMVERFADNLEDDVLPVFAKSLATVLDEERAGYRPVLADGRCLIVPISNAFELEEVETACATDSAAVNDCMQRAIKQFAKREHPDYVNAVKDAISAVESALRIYCPQESTLGKALRRLNKNNDVNMNPRLREALEKLYGYACETVRHGTEEPVSVTLAEAKLMVVTCSAIVNYILSEGDMLTG